MPPSEHSQSRGRSFARWPYAACCASLLLGAACGVDDRPLLGAGGSSNVNIGGGSSGSASDPGLAGASNDEQPLPRCVYLGTDVEAGCETLVKNAGFSSNVAGWSAEPLGMSEGWLNADAKDDSKSGSLVVMNLNYKEDPEAEKGVNGGGSRQCIAVDAGQTYDLAADLFIPSGQGAGFEGVQYTSVATLSAFYYEAADCGGRSVGSFSSKAVDQTDEWVHVEGSTTIPKESVSMAVRLATLKPFRQVSFEAHFDNVFVRERTP